jgi:alanine racemase
MDQFLVRLDDVTGAAVGDEVVLLGQQGQARLPAEALALRWGTINYDLVCGIGARVPRVYV